MSSIVKNALTTCQRYLKQHVISNPKGDPLFIFGLVVCVMATNNAFPISHHISYQNISFLHAFSVYSL